MKVITCPNAEYFSSLMLKKFCVLNNARTIYKFEEDNDLNVPTKFIKFANGEIKTEIMQSIRGENIYIVQDVANFENQLSCNDAIFQLLTTIDAVRHSSGKNITLILPTFPYSRQHRKTGREGLTASLLCQIFESLDVVRIITLDIHSKEIENSLHKAVLENLFPSESFALTLKSLLTSEDDLVVVSPDTGAVARNKFYATVFKCPLAFLYKERDYSKISTSAADSNIIDIKLLGNVKDKTCFIVDDMIGTGSTIIEAVKFLKYNGAKKIIIAVSLPFFNSNAIDIFEAIYKDGFFDKVIGTNAVFNSRLNKRGWFIRVDISELFAKVIFNLENNLSISDLVDNKSAIQSLL